MSEDEGFTKNFSGILILDWKTGSMRVTKKKTQNLKPFEIPVKIDIDVKVPHVPDIRAKGELVVQPTKVEQMLLEQI